MANLLRSLVFLALLFSFATATTTTTTEKKPIHVVSHYVLTPGGSNEAQANPNLPAGNEQKAPPPPPPSSTDKPLPPGAEFLGSWKVVLENAGVSAMHMQLMPHNKVVWFDATQSGSSRMPNSPNNPNRCRPEEGGRPLDPGEAPRMDCTAHAVEYDIATNKVRPLRVEYNTWCSSGALSRTGALVSTGGVRNGFKAVRLLKPCEGCDFEEKQWALLGNRWYATQHALENGSFVVMGGTGTYNYELIPPDRLQFRPRMHALDFLRESKEFYGENNLYPFVNLLPDGNLFVFARDISIHMEPYTARVIRHYPRLPGGVRNYPPSGMSALLPIELNKWPVHIEVLVCGGNHYGSYNLSDMKIPGSRRRVFLPALKDCGRLNLMKEGAQWVREEMPSPRVMGDMLLLPTGDVLMLNGAKAGTSAWNAASNPNHYPVLYSPHNPRGQRFKVLAPSPIPRMYHSSSAVLPDGTVLVGGSNTNAFYMHEKVPGFEFSYPTELRVEKFSPPYLAPQLQKYRPEILEATSDKTWIYGRDFSLRFKLPGGGNFNQTDVKVTMYSPPFTTHGYSMNQRLLVLKLKEVSYGHIRVIAPPSGKYAPPGYYLVFIVHHGVPSHGMWVNIH